MHPLARLDHAYVWHPFTQMRDWLRREPIVLSRGRGAVLEDVHGRTYLDANSSIWTNLHGHNQRHLNAAIRRQLTQVAHTSALGLANEPASQLAARLVKRANPPALARTRPAVGPKLCKVFYSDDGSTAVEVALKLAYEFSRRTRGPAPKPRFLTLQNAYHGDTIGALSLGQIPLFQRAFQGLQFKSDAVMAPYCYRCPFNRARPERADARSYRRCHWECVTQVEQKLERAARAGRPYSAFVFEPGIQGAAGMIPQPEGWLQQAGALAQDHGALLVADEVMTGFGRTGSGAGAERRNETGGKPLAGRPRNSPDLLFASHHEGVQPDFLCLAKGLTGGYLPMAATLTTQRVFEAFLGEYEEFKTFFHGHSYTANPLAAAAALASLDLLEADRSRADRRRLESDLQEELAGLWTLPAVGDIRQVGLVAGIELVRDWRKREPFDLRERAGLRVCDAMSRRGVLTRPIGNVIVLMPPYCTTRRQVRQMVGAVHDAVAETLS